MVNCSVAIELKWKSVIMVSQNDIKSTEISHIKIVFFKWKENLIVNAKVNYNSYLKRGHAAYETYWPAPTCTNAKLRIFWHKSGNEHLATEDFNAAARLFVVNFILYFSCYFLLRCILISHHFSPPFIK